MILRALVRAFFSVAFFSLLLTQASCLTRDQNQIPPKQFLEHLEYNDIEVTPVLADSHITLTRVFEGYSPVVGDALFAGSMGGGMVSYADALRTNREKIMSLPDETVLCPGHGPMTTVGEEKKHNPFFPEFKS